MKTLYLIRHGETTEGKKGIILGRKGGTLSVKGKTEIKKIGLKIRSKKLNLKDTLIISSDLKRAKDSAFILKNILSCKLEYNPLLRERAAGVAEGKAEKDIDWEIYEQKSFMKRKHKGGESFSDVKIRTEKFLRKIEKLPYKNIIIVSHSVVIASILSCLKKKSLKKLLTEIKPMQIVRVKK